MINVLQRYFGDFLEAMFHMLLQMFDSATNVRSSVSSFDYVIPIFICLDRIPLLCSVNIDYLHTAEGISRHIPIY